MSFLLYTLDELAREGELKPCTYCGVLRRKLLNQKAMELGLNRLATGHNLDDEAQAIMMNYISGDIERLRRLTGGVDREDLVNRIKPLSRMPEKEVMLYAALNKLEVSTDECPYANENHRTMVRDFLNSLEKEKPGVKFSIVKGWERIIESTPLNGDMVQKCSFCGQAAAREVCRACELTQGIKIKMSGAS